MLAIQLIGGFICGLVAVAIASSKGRNAVGWFFGGFFGGLIGVIIVACLSNLKEEQARFAKIEQDRRRLREQLRQEQIKAEAFRLHAAHRLDAHDKTLGVDTRQTAILLEGPAQTPNAMPSSPEQALAAMAQSTGTMTQSSGAMSVAPPVFTPVETPVWFYEVSGQSRGPVRESDLMALIRQGAVKAHTLLWRDGFDDWTPAGEVSQFVSAVRA